MAKKAGAKKSATTTASPDTTLEAAGRTIRLTHPDKVLYPNADHSDARTKLEIAEYYRAVAPALLHHAADRPATRMRWPDGTDGEMFVEKNLPQGAPDWLTTASIEHSTRTATYPVLDSAAALVWCAQMAALELHVPQWTLQGGEPGKTRRLVIDLDPGPEITLDQTARLALRVRDLLADAGLESWPVTSGSKGIHVYARLPRAVTSRAASTLARTVADGLAAQTPDEVTAVMKKTERTGRVLVDWSQNSAAKTTVAPYSLRARDRPLVAAPRSWAELGDGGLEQLTAAQVLQRLESDGDLLAGLAPAASADDSATPLAETVDLTAYRRKRDRQKTPEPFGDSDPAIGTPTHPVPIFVIQEHHSRALHYDVRFEHDGVLVSWAVPRNLPDEPGVRRLAVRTEDHPMDYADFAGTIPKGEYGGGTVEIWDRGTIEVEKWRDDEVLVELRGERVRGRYAFVRTTAGERDGTKAQWIVQRRADDAEGRATTQDGDEEFPPHSIEAAPKTADLPDALRDPRPMLPTDREVGRLTASRWAFETKWDGYRAIVSVVDGVTRITSRNGHDLTDRVPGLEHLPAELGMDAVLDAELVALDTDGRARFGALAARESGGEDVPVSLVVFDVLWVDGTSLLRTRWERRREVLDELAPRLRKLGTGAANPLLVPEPLEAETGAQALDQASEQGAEGVVAKRRDASYLPGTRSQSWLKEKFWTTTDVVVGGWRPGKSGSRGLGSLLVGVPENNQLTYLGRVGSGLSGAVADQLADELSELARRRSPFGSELPREVTADARWALPRIVVEVRHHGITDHGHLRHPSLRGIRRDKLPGDL